MNNYYIKSATKSDMDFILNLNQNNMPAVSMLSSDLFLKFLNISDYIKIIKNDDESVGFLIALFPNKLYDSINYQWFNKHYKSFIYVDRIVVLNSNQNKGIGSYFYNDIKYKYINKVSHLACEVNIKPLNQQSINFHKKFGFKQVGQQFSEENKKLVSLQVFKLKN